MFSLTNFRAISPSVILLASILGLSLTANAVTSESCSLLMRPRLVQPVEKSRAEMFRRDEGEQIERRIKILTDGTRRNASDDMDPTDLKIDSADPSLVMPIKYPNGSIKYRINFSGLRYIESVNPSDFFRGGVFKVQRSRGFYADGTEMTGPYHNASWPWDVVIYQNARGENIALGGVMEQAKTGSLPSVAENNHSRSRWWGNVEHLARADGSYEERIIWRAPVHDFNRDEGAKLGKAPDWNKHGYGGTLFTKFNSQTGLHEPVRLSNGNYLLFYERVTKQKRLQSGAIKPWVTTMFAREMNPRLTNAVGKEYLATDLISPVTGKPFAAVKRGAVGEDDGLLGEGGNILVDRSNGTVIKAFSANDYVRDYGIYLDYRPPGSDPRGMYSPVMDERGELVDFAAEMHLREIMNATWLGRPQLIYAPDGKLWLEFHFVPKESIPAGAPTSGWPTAEQFLSYGRITAIAPVKIEYKNDVPRLALDLAN